MPSTYAHYKFGRQVFQKLPSTIQVEISENLNLYLIGLHGPDILFYYNALVPNHVNKVGFRVHEQKAKDFFYPAEKRILAGKMGKGARAYLYGCLCHFALDHECHPYIEKKIAESGISHTEIEVEFDRQLMAFDSHNPITHHLTKHISASDADCEIIAQFYPSIKGTEIHKALWDMQKYNDFLIAPSRWKRFWIYTLLRITGNYKEMHGCIVNYSPNPKCQDSNAKLTKLYANAMLEAERMIVECSASLNQHHITMEQEFEHSFGVE